MWKKIKFIPYKNTKHCIRALKKKSYVSPWIIDIFKNKNYNLSKYKNLELHRIRVKDLGFKTPTKLKKIYSMLKKRGFNLIKPEIAIYTRLIYKDQPIGEWLRIAVPFNSMVDSDGVPHLPKLGRALGKNFIETYWSYPNAIFHPHNDFLVEKKNK